MRFGPSAALIDCAAGFLAGCGSDGTYATIPRGDDGIFAGGSAKAPSSGADGTTGSGAGDASAPVAESADASMHPPPVAIADASASADAPAVAETDAGPTPTADGAVPNVAGCACGCADACLTELIEACKAPTPVLVLVCAKVPATCACESTCATPQPTPPSLDACVAQFLLTGS